MKTFKIYVSGTVQGVFFRRFIADKADELNLKGFVRNLDDGRVEVVIEGKDEDAKIMVGICRQGPPHSDVKNVEYEEISHQGFKNFKIMRF